MSSFEREDMSSLSREDISSLAREDMPSCKRRHVSFVREDVFFRREDTSSLVRGRHVKDMSPLAREDMSSPAGGDVSSLARENMSSHAGDCVSSLAREDASSLVREHDVPFAVRPRGHDHMTWCPEKANLSCEVPWAFRQAQKWVTQ